MGGTGASLKRSVMTMSITLVVTAVVLFTSCSTPAASSQTSNPSRVTTGPTGIR